MWVVPPVKTNVLVLCLGWGQKLEGGDPNQTYMVIIRWGTPSVEWSVAAAPKSLGR